jgi:DNA-directed RNA polymerase subunit RPC12/RpoP
MMHPEFTCKHCGSANFRRSHSASLLDTFRMAKGTYPFRCLDCRERFWINLWLLSKGKRARCPRCLTLELTPAQPQRMRLGLWRKVMLALGARGYRCSFCGHKFLSFKRSVAEQSPGPPEHTTTHASQPPGMASAATASK